VCGKEIATKFVDDRIIYLFDGQDRHRDALELVHNLYFEWKNRYCYCGKHLTSRVKNSYFCNRTRALHQANFVLPRKSRCVRKDIFDYMTCKHTT
jgi:hypothetical protein